MPYEILHTYRPGHRWSVTEQPNTPAIPGVVTVDNPGVYKTHVIANDYYQAMAMGVSLIHKFIEEENATLFIVIKQGDSYTVQRALPYTGLELDHVITDTVNKTHYVYVKPSLAQRDDPYVQALADGRELIEVFAEVE